MSTEKKSMYIQMSGWHTFDYGYVSFLVVTGWNKRGFRWISPLLWCWLSSEVLCQRCTHAFASPVCLLILGWAILAREAAVSLSFLHHCRVSFHPRLHIFMPTKLNSPHVLFLDFGTRFRDLKLCFLHCGTRKPPFGHFSHIQGKEHLILSGCTRPPCLAIVGDTLKTYMKSVAPSSYYIRVLPLTYTLP